MKKSLTVILSAVAAGLVGVLAGFAVSPASASDSGKTPYMECYRTDVTPPTPSQKPTEEPGGGGSTGGPGPTEDPGGGGNAGGNGGPSGGLFGGSDG
jgi:hypothetical protein